MTMHKRMLTLVALAVCAATVLVAAPAQANFRVGMSDQNADMFGQKNFQALKIKRVRYIVPYDWYKNQGNENDVISFMAHAQAAGADVLVHFGARRGCYNAGRYSRSKRCRAPSVATYKAAFKRFRSEYPFVNTYGVWNEGNHVSQPTFNKPKLAAKYFLAARSACPACTLVAADVLDNKAMVPWLRTFLRFSKGKAKIFGLHNYSDVNRGRASGTRTLLATVPGEVWLTETGGILKFLPAFRRNERRQARATKFMFKLANKYDSRQRGTRARITRLYNYQYTGAAKSARFDSGLVNPNQSARKAYKVFKQLAARRLR